MRRLADAFRDLDVIDSRAPRFNQATIGGLSALAVATGWWRRLAVLAEQLVQPRILYRLRGVQDRLPAARTPLPLLPRAAAPGGLGGLVARPGCEPVEEAGLVRVEVGGELELEAVGRVGGRQIEAALVETGGMVAAAPLAALDRGEGSEAHAQSLRAARLRGIGALPQRRGAKVLTSDTL